MFKGLMLAATTLIFLSCAPAPEKKPAQKDQITEEEVVVTPEEDRLPKDASPRPVRPTCPPGMAPC